MQGVMQSDLCNFNTLAEGISCFWPGFASLVDIFDSIKYIYSIYIFQHHKNRTSPVRKSVCPSVATQTNLSVLKPFT